MFLRLLGINLTMMTSIGTDFLLLCVLIQGVSFMKLMWPYAFVFCSFVHGRLPYQMLKPDPVLRNILLNVPVRKVVSFLPWLRTL
jgi:hypothetical protein